MNHEQHKLKITMLETGYQAALNNIPTRDGFKIQLTHADIYSNGSKKARINVVGSRTGNNNQIRVRGEVISDNEEYGYNEIRLIDGLSGSVFCSVKRTDDGVLDYVSPYKKSIISYNLAFSSVNGNITIATDEGNVLALLLEDHDEDELAHYSLFEQKLNKNQLSDSVQEARSGMVASSKAVKTAYEQAIKSATLEEAGRVQLSNATDSTSETTAATSKAVKVAYDRAVEAEGKGVPIGAIIAFSKEVATPLGFLKCNGQVFSQEVYPALYQALGNKNKVPDLTRSDVGQLAYFPFDSVPDGWIEFDKVQESVTQEHYPELYQLLVQKYGSIEAVPKSEDRFIRSAHNGLLVGQVQGDAIRNITGQMGFRKHGYVNGLQEGAFLYEGKTITYDAHGITLTTTDNGASPIQFDASRVVPTADENRPKAIVFKLCIKVKNSLDDVQFLIKAFGSVADDETLNLQTLINSVQEKVQALEHLKRDSSVNSPEQVEKIEKISKVVAGLKELKYLGFNTKKVFEGAAAEGTQIDLSEDVRGCFITLILTSSSGTPLEFGTQRIAQFTTFIPDTQFTETPTTYAEVTSSLEPRLSPISIGHLPKKILVNSLRRWIVREVYKHNPHGNVAILDVDALQIINEFREEYPNTFVLPV